VDPDSIGVLGPALENARFPDHAPQLYGDGHAAEKIATALLAS